MSEGIIRTVQGYKCAFCQDYTTPYESTMVRHFDNAHKNHSVEYNNKKMYLCKKLCQARSHYHCQCGCSGVFRKSRLMDHLAKVDPATAKPPAAEPPPAEPPPPPSEVSTVKSAATTEPTITVAAETTNVGGDDHIDFSVASLRGNENKVKCPECTLVLHKKNLSTHMERKHQHNPGTVVKKFVGSCVDLNNGVYLVAERLCGVHHPIHVQKYIVGNKPPIMSCESQSCEYQKIISGISGNPSFECEHLLSVQLLGSPHKVSLDEAGLDHLVKEKRIDLATKKNCLWFKKEAESRGYSLINAMVHEPSDRFIFMSVWTGNISHYSRLGRVILFFDKESFDLVCKCNGSSRIGCSHKPIAKWFLQCAYPDIFVTASTECVKGIKITSKSLDKGYDNVVEYQYKKKLMPTDIPNNCIVERFDSDIIVVPSEENCDECCGKLALKELKGTAKLLTRFGFVPVLKVWAKYCKNCSMEYHYCDMTAGFFNFNNKFFMSIDLLIWLQNAIVEHTALSREINLLEKQYKVNINHDLVRRCFYKFLALTDDKDAFKCYICGDHPVILTFDVNRKCAFKMENSNQCPPECELVDGRKFWDGVRKEAISRSLCSRETITPTMQYWAPYIGEQSRNGDLVYNTEFRKGSKDNEEQQFLECLSEESLEGLLDTDLSTLREVCSKIGIDASKSSKLNCIVKLKSALTSRTRIDKFFFKIWYSSGGLLTCTCPHGVVYAFKALLTPESPRDVGDLLLSMKYPPTVVISDVPHMVASHVNKRSINFFYPNAGRVAEPTEDNIMLVENDKFKPLSFPWLNNRMYQAPPNLNTASMSIHPITLVHQRFSLYDKFHEGNSSQKKELLRRTGLVKELDGVITETAEQLNAFLSKSLYYLDGLSPLHHLLVVKCLFSLRNKAINNKMVKDKSFQFDIYGRAMFTNKMAPGLAPPNQDVPASQLPPQQKVPSKNYSDVQQQKQHQSSISEQQTQQQQQQHKQQSSTWQQQRRRQQKQQQKQQQSTSQQQKQQEQQQQCKRKQTLQINDPAKFRKLFHHNYSSDDLDLFALTKPLWKGLHNPLNNCWFNSVMMATRYTFGTSRLYEDFLLSQVNEWEAYNKLLNPVLASLSITSTDQLLASDELANCLTTYFKDSNSIAVGREQDPLNFFNLSTGTVDSNSIYSFNSSSIYEIEISSNLVCMKCGENSPGKSKEPCLSLSLDRGISTTILDLINKYFEDELMDERPCPCGGSLSAMRKTVSNSPEALAIHLKRYDENFTKSTEVVTPDRWLDLSHIMVTKSFNYLLRAVITHKGDDINTGHYTTTIVEGDMLIEVDGSNSSLLRKTDDMHTGGYIFIYEKSSLIDTLMKIWFHCTFLMSAIMKYFTTKKSTLTVFLTKIWTHIKVSDESLKLTTMLVDVLAGNMGRIFNLGMESYCQAGTKIECFRYLLKIMGAEEQFRSYFMLKVCCDKCGLHQKHFVEVANIKCSELSMDVILEEISYLFDGDCYECDALLNFDDSLPILLSKYLLINTVGGCFTLADKAESMPLFHSYLLETVLVNDAAVVSKDGKFFVASNREIMALNDCDALKGDKLILLKGKEIPWCFEEDQTHAYPATKLYDGHVEEDKVKLDACLPSISEGNAGLVQSVLYQGDVCPKFCEYFFNFVCESSVYYISFKSSNDFLNATIGSVLCLIKLKKIHKFIHFDFGDASSLMKLSTTKLYHIGKSSLDVGQKILKIIEVLQHNFPVKSKYEVVLITSASSFHRIQQMKIAYCIISGGNIEVETGDAIFVTVISLLLKKLTSDSISMAIKKKCRFIDSVPLSPPVLPDVILVSDGTCVLGKPVRSHKVVEAVKERYLIREIGLLNNNICGHVLCFLMEKQDVVKAYYFQNRDVLDISEINRIQNLLSLSKYRTFSKRLSLLVHNESSLLKCIPVMVYRCFQDAVNYLLLNEASFADNISTYGRFPVVDFIELIVVKAIVIKFVVAHCKITEQDVLSQVGLIGEDLCE